VYLGGRDRGDGGVAREVSRPRWVAPVTLALAVTGAAVSAFLTIAHYTTPAILACDASGIVDCERVTTSAQSAVFGIPVALLGFLWFLAMIGCCAPAAWRSPVRAVRALRVALAASGMGFVLWLVYAELYIIQRICLWCTGVHFLTFILFTVIMAYAQESE
jgi:uncharacterized membrane protein